MQVKEIPTVAAEVQTTKSELPAGEDDLNGEQITTPDDLSEIRIEERKELTKTYSDDLYPLGDYFWDEFGEFRKQYDLSTAESEMLGKWIDIDDARTTTVFNGNYYFFPNKLFAIEIIPANYIFIEEENMQLYFVFGVWYVENGMVRAKIYSFQKRTYKGGERKREFFMVTPYEMEIIDSRFIDPVGYSTHHFNNFVLPPELEGKIRMSDKVKITYRMARTVFTRNPLEGIGGGELKKEYRYFDIMPDLARNNLSGIDIVTDLELLEKYFHERKN